MPIGDDPLEVVYTANEYLEVEQDDAEFVDQTASNQQYAIHQFRRQNTNDTDTINIRIDARSSIGAVGQPVYMQILNRTSGAWETIDSNNTAIADEEFSLTAEVVGSMSDYYSPSYWVSVRVYQNAWR